jgi:hypothetical protein
MKMKICKIPSSILVSANQSEAEGTSDEAVLNKLHGKTKKSGCFYLIA